MIQVFCVGCGKSVRAKEEWRGRKVNCRACGVSFTVPLESAAEEPGSMPPAVDDGEQPGGVSETLASTKRRFSGRGVKRLGLGMLVAAVVIFFGRESIASFFGNLIGPAKVAQAPGPLSVPVAFLAILIALLGIIFVVAGALVSAVAGSRS